MSKLSLSSTRRRFLALAAPAGALGLVSGRTAMAAADGAIRPFRFEAPGAELADLRQRLAATRWPERELVAEQSQGVQLATMQKLVRYWSTDYDWRNVEARLNALPQFITEIDGLDIHFIHVRS